jgi:hypothetical protein
MKAAVLVLSGICYLLSTSIASAQSVGSGFLLSETGLIATNFHVIEGAQRIEVALPGQPTRLVAQVLVQDKRNDLVILKVTIERGMIAGSQRWFSFGDQAAVRRGDEVIALGYPFGDILGSTVRATRGNVNALLGLGDDPRLLNIDNPVQPGNSGGPVFSTNGALIGVVVSRLNSKYFFENLGAIPENVNFAIKASYLKALLEVAADGKAVVNRNEQPTHPTTAGDIIEAYSPLVVRVYGDGRADTNADAVGSLSGRHVYLNLQKLADQSSLGKRLSLKVRDLQERRASESAKLSGRAKTAFDRKAALEVQQLQVDCQTEFQRKLEPLLAQFVAQHSVAVIFSEVDADGIVFLGGGKSPDQFKGLWGQPSRNVTDAIREILDAAWK